MKKIVLYLLACFLTAGMWSGCISEKNNTEDCSIGNVTLIFSLPDAEGKESLREHIEQIDLILFRNEVFHSQDRIPVSSLDESRSLIMELEPGTYQAVAWGNLKGNLRMSELYDRMSPEIGTVTFYSIETGDPLYYAAAPALGLSRMINPDNQLYTFTVPQSGSVTQTLIFKHAHKVVDVYVKGYSVDGLLPVIEVEGDYDGYDFYMNHRSEHLVTLRQDSQLTQTTEGELAHASFYTSRLYEDNTVAIHIINPVTGTTVYTVTINEAVDLIDDFDYDTEITISVYIEFFEGKFEVKPVTWLTTPSKPGLD